jgi:hypothetical protein
MKKLLIKSIFLYLLFSLSTLSTGCKTGEGCQMEEKYQVKTDKNGNLSKKKGKSSLWSKKQRKKMKSGR